MTSVCGKHWKPLGATRLNARGYTGYILEVVNTDIMILLVIFKNFTSYCLCFFLWTSYKMLWSQTSLLMIVVVFFIKNAEEESGSKLFEIVRKK